MNKEKIINIIIVSILLFLFFNSTAYAGQYDINKIDITPHFIVIIMLLQIMMIGVFIILIITYIAFKKKMQIIDKVAQDKKINENVINIRKYNDQEMLNMLYEYIDNKFNATSEKDELD